MSSSDGITIGTRGSALAMAQAAILRDALRDIGVEVRVEAITTDGDLRAPDTAWGEGAFVTAIETALLDGRVDVAIHSAKDLPTDEDARLTIAAYLAREDPRDALVVAVPPGAGDLPSADSATNRRSTLPASQRRREVTGQRRCVCQSAPHRQ